MHPESNCVCLACGRAFHAYPSEVARKGRRFCSRACRARNRARNAAYQERNRDRLIAYLREYRRKKKANSGPLFAEGVA